MKSVIDVIRETIYVLSLPKMNLIDVLEIVIIAFVLYHICLLYTSPSPRDRQKSRNPTSA